MKCLDLSRIEKQKNLSSVEMPLRVEYLPLSVVAHVVGRDTKKLGDLICSPSRLKAKTLACLKGLWYCYYRTGGWDILSPLMSAYEIIKHSCKQFGLLQPKGPREVKRMMLKAPDAFPKQYLPLGIEVEIEDSQASGSFGYASNRVRRIGGVRSAKALKDFVAHSANNTTKFNRTLQLSV